MSVLVCGALAYDTIMVFAGHFREQFLSDRLHRLNVSFHVPKMRREFGGCAGNIAYNLTRLGVAAAPVSAVGHDFGPYRAWLDRHGIDRRYVRELGDEFTAQAFITTDLDDNQITAFHPGAMRHGPGGEIEIGAQVRIGVVAPDEPDRMLAAARRFSEAGVPSLFDPGQFLHSLSAQEILELVDRARWVTVNDYEARMMAERSGLTLASLAERVEALVVTHGKDGSQVWQGAGKLAIPAAAAREVVDPTGCGDAFRAGLIYGLLQDRPWEQIGRIGSVVGALAAECHGTQNHDVDAAILARRYEENFGHTLAG